MIRRIILKNYMAHASTVIEPAPGLTVLVGPNNCGKSAVVSALETLCSNASGSYMVRHDEKETLVTVETDDEHRLVWRRKGNIVSYIIDGHEIHRVRGSIPEDLHRFLRLPKVEAGENGEPFDIHFGAQKSPIFLLNEPESRAALFFASSSDAAILLEMQKRHRSKVKERKNDEKRLKREVHKLDVELASLEPLDGIAIRVSQANQAYQYCTKLAKRLIALEADSNDINTCLLQHARLQRTSQSLAPLKPVPHLTDTSKLGSTIDDLVEAQRNLNVDKARCGPLSLLQSQPDLADVTSLESMVCSMDHAQERCSRWLLRWANIRPLRSPPALEDADGLWSLWNGISEEQTCKRGLASRAMALRSLKEPPQIADMTPLSSMADALKSAQLLNGTFGQRQGALRDLVFPPQLEETKQLEDLVSQLAISQGDMSSLSQLLYETARDLTNVQNLIDAHSRAGSQYPMFGDSATRPRSLVPMALSALAAVTLLFLLIIFRPGWLVRLDMAASNQTAKPTEQAAKLMANHNDRGNGVPLAGSQQNAEKDLHKDEQRNNVEKLQHKIGPRGNDEIRREQPGPGVPVLDSETSSKQQPGKQSEPRRDESPQAASRQKAENELHKDEQQNDVKELQPTNGPRGKDQSRRERPGSADPPPDSEAASTKQQPWSKVAPQPSQATRDSLKKRELKDGQLHKGDAEQRQIRVMHIRQLLDKANDAYERGNYLEALLGFGQAAILYPKELSEVEQPEKLRTRFLEALRRYQAQVEHALERAANRRAEDELPLRP